jgi:hypothetical protein
MDKIVEMNVKNSIEMWDGENTINFNLFPEILIHHQKELVESKGIKKHLNRHVQNPKLRKFIYFISDYLKKYQIDSLEFSKYLIEQMNEAKFITQKDFDKLLNNVRALIEMYNSRLSTIDTLIENNKESENVLTALKNRIQKGIFFPDMGERFFEFCQLEYQKNKIYETGIVPLGWLPSDVLNMSILLEKLGISLEDNEELTKRLETYAKRKSLIDLARAVSR